MTTRMNLKPNIRRRRNDAVLRKAARDALTPAQQLARLDTLLGKGVGASKERARLHSG